MLVLGIECTAHTFGIGIIEADKKEILFNEKNVYSNPDEGMNPRKLSEFHIGSFQEVLLKAKHFLEKNNLSFSSINLITFSQGPGQGNSLKVGGLVAKTLSLKYNISIVGVNHIRSHLEIGKMITGFDDPMFLNITGVNSQVISWGENDNYVVYGETEDIGLGNLLDSCARMMNLGFPGGPLIEKKAREGKNFITIPYTLKGMNVSFAGLNSFIKQHLQKAKKTFKEKKDYLIEDNSYSNMNLLINDLCFSLQETVFSMVLEVAERALAYTNKKHLVLVGGVAANLRFTEMAMKMCEDRSVEYKSTPLALCMDNGVMIAWAGFIIKERSRKSISNLQPKPYITVENDI